MLTFPVSLFGVTVPTGPPGIPTSVVVTPNAAGQLTVTWGAPASGGTPTYYRVEFDDGGGFVEVYNALSPLTHTVGSLTDGTSYPFKVYAGNLDGESAAVDASSYTLPGIPTSIVVTPGLGELPFTWAAPGAGLQDGFEAEYATDYIGPWTTNTYGSSDTAGSFTSLSAGDYYFRIRTKLTAGTLYSAWMGSGDIPSYSGPHTVT